MAASSMPLPAYHFQVQWGGTRGGFAEVSGLDIEYEVIEYRDGLSPDYSVKKMPGLVKYSNITLKRGIVPKDNDFFSWINSDGSDRRDIIISLLDKEHSPVMSWKVKGAFAVKLIGPVLNATSKEVAIETLEIAHEGLTVECP